MVGFLLEKELLPNWFANAWKLAANSTMASCKAAEGAVEPEEIGEEVCDGTPSETEGVDRTELIDCEIIFNELTKRLPRSAVLNKFFSSEIFTASLYEFTNA